MPLNLLLCKVRGWEHLFFGPEFPGAFPMVRLEVNASNIPARLFIICFKLKMMVLMHGRDF